MSITPLKDAMCSRGNRINASLNEWYSKNRSDDIEVLRKRLDDMHLVGRTIKDIRFTSFCYNMEINGMEDTVWRRMRGYPAELQKSLSEFKNIDDNFPFPVYLEMDEPVLIRFEDGDCFDVDTSAEDNFGISMNEIPWNIASHANPENINASILLDFCKGAKIEKAEVTTYKGNDGNIYLEGIKLSWMHDRCLASMHFESTLGDYLIFYIEFGNQAFNVPFFKVKQSMYKEYYGKGTRSTL